MSNAARGQVLPDGDARQPSAQLDRKPVEETRSESGATPFTSAPLPSMAFHGQRLTIKPELMLIEISAKISDTDDDLKIRLPAVGVTGVYNFNDRFSVFALAYATKLGGDFDAAVLKGNLSLGLGVGVLGGAANIIGPDRDDPLRLVASLALMTFTMSGVLTEGESFGTKFTDEPLFRFQAFAAVSALQLEWRFWRYLSAVPFVTGWRLLALRLKAGQANASFEPSTQWHFSPGLDVWLYVFPESPSHFSLGALVALSDDSPVTTFSLAYTFVWDLGDQDGAPKPGEPPLGARVPAPATDPR